MSAKVIPCLPALYRLSYVNDKLLVTFYDPIRVSKNAINMPVKTTGLIR